MKRFWFGIGNLLDMFSDGYFAVGWLAVVCAYEVWCR